MPHTKFLLTEQNLETYLQAKISNGVFPVSVAKYKTPLFHLCDWLGEDKELSAVRLQAWRKSLDEYGYGKITVQKYVVVVNTFLRANGRSDLCIPKPVKNELAGKTFGYLTALEPTGERHRRYVVWRCVCKCGKEVEMPSGMLIGGRTTSCGYTGVTRSKGQWVASISIKKYRYRLGAYDKLGDATAARKLAEELVSVGDLDALNAICTNWKKEQSPSVGG